MAHKNIYMKYFKYFKYIYIKYQEMAHKNTVNIV